jgi:hypothetical protein
MAMAARCKGKGKGRFAGSIQHCSLMADCTLAPEWFLPSSPEALRTKRRERPLQAKEGSLTHEFCQGPVIYCRRVGSFHMPQSWDMGQIV